MSFKTFIIWDPTDLDLPLTTHSQPLKEDKTCKRDIKEIINNTCR